MAIINHGSEWEEEEVGDREREQAEVKKTKQQFFLFFHFSVAAAELALP